jgi:hypothetical protein
MSLNENKNQKTRNNQKRKYTETFRRKLSAILDRNVSLKEAKEWMGMMEYKCG